MQPKTINTANRVTNFLSWFSIGLGTLETFAPTILGRLLGLERHTALLRFYGLRELTAGGALLTQTTTPQWLWARVAGDAVDIVTLTLLLGPDNRKRANAGVALAAVLGITGLDLWAALQLTRAQAESVHPQAERVEPQLGRSGVRPSFPSKP
ncbi:hypothetical protein MF271_10715 [Deinococcus sp. KNUC1210]|uniref:hypothetical protein n=1 Tax=Deinococcus sp. KNUC1210 TaxID=2917691 RepID=UPI001EEF8613|nr:hypothetical protein [Deinococcus sp. KNUC1210]ULH14504.1 hypothetical protein MF271_10715 [Deinococcus sp. KNUC1210]